jgi:hypothetical protein
MTKSRPLPASRGDLVDVVYLWVDGNDPAWRLRRQAAAGRPARRQPGNHAANHAANPAAEVQKTARAAAPRDGGAVFGNVEGRYRDNDELRHSLRALERFFPGHGHVYIVTDRQRPIWLADRPGLTVVDHRDIIPAAALPLFDSGNIESYIHRIPGLSERFFYLNDDTFFGRPVQLADWFTDNGFFTTWSDEPEVAGLQFVPEDTALVNASRLSGAWLAQCVPGYTHRPSTFAHAPRPLRVSVLRSLETDISPALFASVRATAFRAWHSPPLVSDFVLRWAIVAGIAQCRSYCSAHVASGDDDALVGLARLVDGQGRLDFFCINDTTDDADADDPRLTAVRQTLAALFPDASSFERVVAAVGPARALAAARYQAEPAWV